MDDRADDHAKALALWQEGYRLQMAGDLDAAIEAYRRSLAVLPTAEAHTFLGWAMSFQGRLDEAIAACHDAIAVDPAFGNPCHALLFYLLFRLVRRLHGPRADTPLFHFNFLFLGSALAFVVLLAKYQALAFFSDAMSFQIVRNLGGGSLVDAFLYVLSEAALVLIAAAGAASVYAASLLFLRRRWRGLGPLPDRTRLSGKQVALALAAVPVLLFAANRIDAARSALIRFNSVIALTAAMEQL
ncbi:MAG TPA: hypothetical protein VEA38_14705, partial [Terriglobales bacterium]|nr:hypothetical protein [Terriglobales bacterium]